MTRWLEAARQVSMLADLTDLTDLTHSGREPSFAPLNPESVKSVKSVKSGEGEPLQRPARPSAEVIILSAIRAGNRMQAEGPVIAARAGVFGEGVGSSGGPSENSALTRLWPPEYGDGCHART